MTPELLSPAGGLDAALAAFQYGADAVYIGLPRFSARADADNVTSERLRALIDYARSFQPPKKIYVTFNTLVQDAELPQALDALDTLADLSPDGVIVQDLGVARLIRDHFPRLALHASTQLAAHSLSGVRALKDLGFSRVVLARELTLEEIRHITRESGVEIEIFVHGALCYSYSGLCLFSSHTTGRSGNRGRCAYCCREAFSPDADLLPPSSGRRPRFPFSMRDLALAPLLDEVVATGAHSLKIEGRMKSPLYVACVTDYYRRKLNRTLSPDDERLLVQDLQTIFSRPWTSLYAQGVDAAPDDVIDPLAVGHRGAAIGRVETVVRDRDGSRWLRFTTTRALEKHDGLQIELPDCGRPFGFAVNLLREAGQFKPLISVPANARVDVALPEEDVPMIPPHAPVFCSASQAVRRRYPIQSLRESSLASGRPADVRVALAPSGIATHASASFDVPGDVTAAATLSLALAPSRQPEQTEPAVRKAFERLGETAWRLGALTLDDPKGVYAPASKLNEVRRELFEKLTEAWENRRAERRLSIAQSWGFGTPSERSPETSRWSLKLRADRPPLPPEALADIDALVLAIGHVPYATLRPQLEAWQPLAGPNGIRLALPPVTREAAVPALRETLRALVQGGWRNWECSDLGGHRLLADAGVVPVSADWSLYAFNRIAAAELVRLGFGSFVLSPENSLENALALASPACELLVYQHTPLFLSATAPCATPEDARAEEVLPFSDRRGHTFLSRAIDDLWVTVWRDAFCIADRLAELNFGRYRIDLSWSPEPERFTDVIRDVISGRQPPDTHAANFLRGLA